MGVLPRCADLFCFTISSWPQKIICRCLYVYEGPSSVTPAPPPPGGVYGFEGGWVGGLVSQNLRETIYPPPPSRKGLLRAQSDTGWPSLAQRNAGGGGGICGPHITTYLHILPACFSMVILGYSQRGTMVSVVLVSSAGVLTVCYCLPVASHVPCHVSRLLCISLHFPVAQHGIPRVPDS